MCGITGIIAKKERLATDAVATVAQMNAAIQHRGPDEAGFYNDEQCALAMRRLSIIDLEGGLQPIWNESRDVLVFLNGEIYNYRELKQQLEKRGHVFRTSSDTEVLVHLYEEYGESMLAHLKGMFAFCLFDRTHSKFLIGRDRFGEKPLYYCDSDAAFSFSSELGSLLQNKSIDRVLDREALQYYLRTSLIPEALTLFQGIKPLPPGHFIRIEQGTVSMEKYFSIDYRINHDIKTMEDATDFIRPRLLHAIKSQSVSDVPIGAFLSGGIDSSTVVALLQQQSKSPIQTFNVRFEDTEFDESLIAREVAKHCGTDHHELSIPNAEFSESLFWEIINRVGQPFRDSSAIPTYYIAKKIREHVKVALSGDGGDELFGGYSIFHWYQKIMKLKQVPATVRAMAGGTTGVIQEVGLFQKASKIRQIDRALKTASLPDDEIPIALNELFTESEIQALVPGNASSWLGEPYALLKQYPKEAAVWSPLRKIMHYRTSHTLTANMLVKVDRMSMANSLEVRAPFLDADLFEASAQLPDQFLMQGDVGKRVIRSMMKNDLPESVFNHPKQGFNIPLHKYQNEAFRNLASRLLFDENPWPELFDKKQLEHIYKQGLEQKQDSSTMSVFRASHQLWMIMQLLGWAERFSVKLA